MLQLWQNWPFPERMPCSAPKFKLKVPAYRRSNCSENLKDLQPMEYLNSKVHEKSVFVRVRVCEILLDAVCDTGASVYCLSPEALFRLPEKIQSSLKPCSKLILAANQALFE